MSEKVVVQAIFLGIPHGYGCQGNQTFGEVVEIEEFDLHMAM